jgi:hypothetical protein
LAGLRQLRKKLKATIRVVLGFFCLVKWNSCFGVLLYPEARFHVAQSLPAFFVLKLAFFLKK